jgi:succinate dehydrogenase/fumarate reductase flavoprotein subunit
LTTTQTDILIIGAGAAGLTAALTAHEHGARVTIIEKGEQLGGTAAISGGIVWIADNPQLNAAGMNDSRDDALAYFRSLDRGDLDEVALRAFVDEGPQALSFLENIGATRLAMLEGYPDYYLEAPGARPEGGRALDNDLFDFGTLGDWSDKVFHHGDVPKLMLRETPLGGGTGMIAPEEMQRRNENDWRGWGQALIGRLLKACLERGLEPQLETAAKSLIIEGGRACGAVVDCRGEQMTIRAGSGVILTTGGYEWDKDLRQTFLRGPLTTPASPPSNTGDGLRIAMAAGAQLGNMTSAWWMPTLSIPGAKWEAGEQRSMPILIERTLPHTIMVNRRGERFCNEANNYSALAGVFHFFDPASYDYPNLPAWLIFDHHYRSRYPLASIMPTDDLPDWVNRADDLPALGQQIGVDSAQLQATVAEFNRHAEQAEDPQFGRGASEYDRFYGDRSQAGAAATLGPLDQAPFYAVKIEMGALGTNGGPRTDGSAQILDQQGEPIPGLFGAGNVIASPTGSVYAGAGGTLGPALTFGYVAGKSAARRANARSD